jgi:hypothetical protein
MGGQLFRLTSSLSASRTHSLHVFADSPFHLPSRHPPLCPLLPLRHPSASRLARTTPSKVAQSRLSGRSTPLHPPNPSHSLQTANGTGISGTAFAARSCALKMSVSSSILTLSVTCEHYTVHQCACLFISTYSVIGLSVCPHSHDS